MSPSLYESGVMVPTEVTVAVAVVCGAAAEVVSVAAVTADATCVFADGV